MQYKINMQILNSYLLYSFSKKYKKLLLRYILNFISLSFIEINIKFTDHYIQKIKWVKIRGSTIPSFICYL
jgi:hypothetical protein